MDPGKLDIRLTCAAGRVAGVAIASSRASAAVLLQGLPVARAAALLAQLFTLCGRAQGAAAAAARGVAREGGVSRHLDGAIAAEAAQEHLWRLLVDWPRELGLESAISVFAHWRRALAGDWQTLHESRFLDFLGGDLFVMAPDAWLGMTTAEDFSDWCFAAKGWAAQLCRQLADEGKGEALLPPVVQLPALDSVAAGMDRPELSQVFSERPTWQGLPAETGAYSRRQGDPLIRALAPQPLLARLVARLQELAALAVNDVARPLPGTVAAQSLGGDRGRALVETARGLLMHELLVADGTVARDVIVAPTEWNFHPEGALPSLLVGRYCATALQAAALARRAVLTLDPCVAHEIAVDWQD